VRYLLDHLHRSCKISKRQARPEKQECEFSLEHPAHLQLWQRVFVAGADPTVENKRHWCTLMACQAEKAVAQAQQCSPSLQGHSGGAHEVALAGMPSAQQPPLCPLLDAQQPPLYPLTDVSQQFQLYPLPVVGDAPMLTDGNLNQWLSASFNSA
jgi:hypothetical protein